MSALLSPCCFSKNMIDSLLDIFNTAHGCMCTAAGRCIQYSCITTSMCIRCNPLHAILHCRSLRLHSSVVQLSWPHDCIFGVLHLQVIITKLKLDKDRKALLERKQGSKDADKGKGKFTEKEVQAMQDVD